LAEIAIAEAISPNNILVKFFIILVNPIIFIQSIFLLAKLSSEDTGSYGITKFLNENIPFGKKPFLPTKFKKEEKSDKLELIDFGYKNQASNPYTNKYSSLSLSINRKTQENINRNRARNGNMKMLLYNKENEPVIVLGPEWPSSLIIIIFLAIL